MASRNRDIPQKVLHVGEKEKYKWSYDKARCPYCDRAFKEDQDSWEATYCPDCGQMLDWK